MRRAVGVALVVLSGGCRFGFDDSTAFRDGASNDATGDAFTQPDAAPTGNVVFITSMPIMPGALGGVAGADAVCNARAEAAGLPGTYAAWVSTSTVNAKDRLAGSRGWRRPDGKPVADQVSDITSRRMFYPINQDETGATVSLGTYAVTFTIGSGTFVGGAYTACGGFTSTAGDTWGATIGNGGAYWTSSAGYSNDCGNVNAHLYCFGIGQDVVVTPPPVTSRRVFWTGTNWTVTSGLAGADTACQNAANGASLGGTFKALLATTTAPAFSRFDTTGPVWVRLDGISIASSMSELLAGNLLAPLNLGPTGYGGGGDTAWLGVVGSGITSSGTTTTTCSDWTTSASGNGSYWVSARFGASSWFGTNDVCTQGHPLICLEP